jgi:RND superfamily putative drug exporter
MAIAAATDYVIFLFGRYQEERARGLDRESAYYAMFHGTAHVILGSGLTIAGAMACLHFTRSPMFNSLGIPLFIGMVVVVAAALTLGPAVVTVASTLRALEPKRAMRIRFWRRLGTAVVRWPGPILVATIALSLVGLLALPGYRTDYNDRNYLPPDIPAAEGFAAAERHFPAARLSPELLMIETDHDMRNSADFLVIDFDFCDHGSQIGLPGLCVAAVELFTHELGEGLNPFWSDVGALPGLGFNPINGRLDDVAFVLQGLDALF